MTYRTLSGYLCAACLLGMALASPAARADARAQLLLFQRQVHTLRAHFEQALYDEHGKRVQQSGGTFLLSRPSRFRWDYTEPYEQVIVSDGNDVWFYDADLEQVTVKRLGSALGNSAALLLSAQRPLDQDFEITDAGKHEGPERTTGEQWVELTPRDQSVSFVKIRMGFKAGNPRVMELTDRFEQTTRLEFSQVERNPVLPPDSFEFTPPPGVDVIRSAE